MYIPIKATLFHWDQRNCLLMLYQNSINFAQCMRIFKCIYGLVLHDTICQILPHIYRHIQWCDWFNICYVYLIKLRTQSISIHFMCNACFGQQAHPVHVLHVCVGMHNSSQITVVQINWTVIHCQLKFKQDINMNCIILTDFIIESLLLCLKSHTLLIISTVY